MMKNRRIAAKYIYPLCAAPIEGGYVEVAPDGTILGFGACTDPASEEEWYDGALVPGFVNAHCHVELSYMRGLFRRGTGMAGFIDQINELRDLKPQDARIEDIRYWMDRMWKRGVQAMADISNCADSFAIKAESPLYTRTFLEVFGTEPEDVESVMTEVGKLAREAARLGLDAAPTPHACYTMSPQLVSAASEAGLRSGYLSFHSEETPEEEEMIRSGSGRMWENRVRAGMSTPPVTGGSSLEYFLDRLQAVHPAPFDEHILLVHEVCLDESGVAAIHKVLRRPFIAVCPLSNLYIHEALPPARLMRRSGISICVGTDSLSSNEDLDMVAELRCLQDNFPEIPLGELLGWACLQGARFLGKEDRFGSFEPGKTPGVVLIDNLDGQGRLSAASTSERLV